MQRMNHKDKKGLYYVKIKYGKKWRENTFNTKR